MIFSHELAYAANYSKQWNKIVLAHNTCKSIPAEVCFSKEDM